MDKKKLAINYLLLIFIGVLLFLQVFMLNRHSTQGDELTSINRKIAEINKENNMLSGKIASLSAVTTIGEKARNYGLASSVRVLSLTTSLPLAANLGLSP